MRLYELIDFLPRTTTRSQVDRNRKIKNASNSEFVGSGHFSSVNQHNSPKRLNQVRKSGTTGTVFDVGDDRAGKNINDDGYLSYIKMVVEDKSQNPYFPRVHNVKTFRSPDGIYYDVDLEKLTDIYSHKIINDEMILSIQDHLFYSEIQEYQNVYETFILSFFSACQGNRGIVKDPILLDALHKIDNVIDKLNEHNNHHRWDMHSGNVMWRITGNMPQLVIVDPIA